MEKKTCEGEDRLVQQLIKNNISLQKKTTELLDNFNTLIKRIDKLLGIFEKASERLSEAEFDEERLKNLFTKLDDLIAQNTEIAKGLIALERYVRGKGEYELKSRF